MHRRSLLLTAPRQLEWIAEDLPPLQPGEVLVKTHAGASSIGAELPQYCGTARSIEAVYYPRMTGYESAGIVIACDAAVHDLHEGERVVAFYGHRTHSIVPENKAIPIPDGISDMLALLAILTCDVSKGIRKLKPTKNEQALVTGAGAIGLLTVFMLKALGVNTVDIIEPVEKRRDLARQLGARSALTPSEAAKSNQLYPIGIECSSRDQAFETLQAAMQPNGRICIISDGNIEPLVLSPHFHEKELRIFASSDGWNYQEHARWYFSYLREHPQQAHLLETLFEYTTTANELAATFEKLANSAISPVKVFVQY